LLRSDYGIKIPGWSDHPGHAWEDRLCAADIVTTLPPRLCCAAARSRPPRDDLAGAITRSYQRPEQIQFFSDNIEDFCNGTRYQGAVPRSPACPPEMPQGVSDRFCLMETGMPPPLRD